MKKWALSETVLHNIVGQVCWIEPSNIIIPQALVPGMSGQPPWPRHRHVLGTFFLVCCSHLFCPWTLVVCLLQKIRKELSPRVLGRKMEPLVPYGEADACFHVNGFTPLWVVPSSVVLCLPGRSSRWSCLSWVLVISWRFVRYSCSLTSARCLSSTCCIRGSLPWFGFPAFWRPWTSAKQMLQETMLVAN